MTNTTRPGRSGSALILALIAFLFMAGIGGAVFSLALAGQRTTSAASFGDAAYHLAEAGIDDVINKMRGYLNNPTLSGADFAVLADVTKDTDGSLMHTYTAELRGGTYTIKVKPPISFDEYNTYVLESEATLAGERRAIRTTTTVRLQKFEHRYGLFGDVYLDAGGNIKTDGYNSAKGKYSDQITGTVGGVPVANKTGNVGSNGDVDVSGSSQIYGNATPGPDKVVTGGGKVYGSTEPSPTTIPLNPTDFTMPSSGVDKTFSKTGITGNATLGSSGTDSVYHASLVSPNGKSVVTIKGNVTLYVDGDFAFAGQPILKIESGSTLTVYQNSSSGTAKFDVAGGSVINSNTLPSTLQLYTNTSKGKLTGNSDFYGNIYAPSTTMSILGTSGLYGSTIAKTIDIQGTPYFHYDENNAAITTGKYNVNVSEIESYVPTLTINATK